MLPSPQSCEVSSAFISSTMSAYLRLSPISTVKRRCQLRCYSTRKLIQVSNGSFAILYAIQNIHFHHRYPLHHFSLHWLYGVTEAAWWRWSFDLLDKDWGEFCCSRKNHRLFWVYEPSRSLHIRSQSLGLVGPLTTELRFVPQAIQRKEDLQVSPWLPSISDENSSRRPLKKCVTVDAVHIVRVSASGFRMVFPLIANGVV